MVIKAPEVIQETSPRFRAVSYHAPDVQKIFTLITIAAESSNIPMDVSAHSLY
jgi:hypothetical protein